MCSIGDEVREEKETTVANRTADEVGFFFFNSSLILILAKGKLVNSLAGFITNHYFIFSYFFKPCLGF